MTNEQIQALRAAAENLATVEERYDRAEITIREYISVNDQYHNFVKDPANILSLLAERAADKALIAEQRQAITKLEISCDRNYVEGMKNGWNYCDAGNSDGFNTCVEQREKDIRDARTAGITLDVGE